MEFEKVIPKSEFLRLEAGGEIIGVFLRKEVNARYPEQMNYIIDIKGEGQKKLLGSAMLDNLFEPVKEGTVVKLIYKGKEKTKKGVEFNSWELWQEKKDKVIGMDGCVHEVKAPEPIYTGK